MRATLIEVEGFERGYSLYSPEWLRDRVRWHLQPDKCRGRVLLIGMPQQEPAGHTILRIEADCSSLFGLVSTTYVVPTMRRRGLATRLLHAAEHWFISEGAQSACTWTSSTNQPLIGLYKRHGYVVTDSAPNDLTGTDMIKLSRSLCAAVA
jgi:GNAT superfamily N-acetyltransferase